MSFKKLFQLLVLGGAVAGTNSACSTNAEAQTAGAKKGTADAGAAPDGGTHAQTGGGAQGW